MKNKSCVSWKDCEGNIQRVLSEERYIDNVNTELACRIKVYSNENKKKKKLRLRAVICQLPSFVDEARLLKKTHRLKGTSYFVNEDFSKKTFCY